MKRIELKVQKRESSKGIKLFGMSVMVIMMSLVMMISFTACGKKDKKADTSNKEIVITEDENIESDENQEVIEEETISPDTVEFKLFVNYGYGDMEELDVMSDKKMLGEALKEQGLIEGTEGKYGLFVDTVNGKKYDIKKDKLYWAFYVNGKYATEGIDKIEVNPKDKYLFKLEKVK